MKHNQLIEQSVNMYDLSFENFVPKFGFCHTPNTLCKGHSSKSGRSEKQIKRDRKRNKMKPKPRHK